MPKKPPPLSGAQLEIMQLVWNADETTVSEIWRALADQRPVARNTVLTVMDRLEKRGWLKKRSVGKTNLYRAAASRQSTLGDVVERLVDTAFAGSADSLMLALLKGRGVSEEEADRIREMLDEARKNNG